MTPIAPDHQAHRQAMPRRRVMTAAALASAMLFALVTSFWVRSYWVADFFAYTHVSEPGFMQVGVDSVRRSIHFTYHRTPASLPSGGSIRFSHAHAPADSVRVLNDVNGFGKVRVASMDGTVFVYHDFWFPHLLAMAVFALLPTWWLLRFRRSRQRVTEGLCLNCGYDLRASVGRCPECGVDPRGGSSIA
jgi:hypothetical protein